MQTSQRLLLVSNLVSKISTEHEPRAHIVCTGWRLDPPEQPGGSYVTTSNDVAAYICERIGHQDPWTMQKLVYYTHAWSLVWDGVPLVANGFQAWRDGPVSRSLYKDGVKTGNSVNLSAVNRATIDAVISFYGSRSSNELIALTHKEAPWRDARGSMGRSEYSSAPISDDGIRSYYAMYGVTAKRFSPEFADAIDLLLLTPDEVLRDGDRVVDGEAFMRWLETGEGESWENRADFEG